MIFSDEGGDSAALLVDILSDYKGSYAVLEKAMNEVRDPISFIFYQLITFISRYSSSVKTSAENSVSARQLMILLPD